MHDSLFRVQPGALANIKKLNELLESKDNYISGLKFVDAEDLGNGQVKFIYDHPNSFTLEESDLAKSLVDIVLNEFHKAE